MLYCFKLTDTDGHDQGECNVIALGTDAAFIRLLIDPYTGVHYIIGPEGGITIRLDDEGKPVVAEDEYTEVIVTCYYTVTEPVLKERVQYPVCYIP